MCASSFDNSTSTSVNCARGIKVFGASKPSASEDKSQEFKVSKHK